MRQNHSKRPRGERFYNPERLRAAATEERLEVFVRRAARHWEELGIAVDSDSIRIDQRRGPELCFDVQASASALGAASFSRELIQFAQAAGWTLQLPAPTIWILEEMQGVGVRVSYSTQPLDS
jgi:hypothetical protein